MTIGRFLIAPALALLAVAAGGGLSGAWAQTNPWTSVGSAGTVDEADAALAAFSGAVVAMAPGTTGTLNIRYNVVAVEGLFGGDGMYMRIRLRDSGAGRVVARLKRYDQVTGVTTTRLTIDSNDAAPQPGFRNLEVADCAGSPSFFDAAYFVDVEITRGVATADPALASLKVSLGLC
jgi:hypothetical protein